MSMNKITRLSALLLALPFALHAGDARPPFSWDRVPVYAHVYNGLMKDDPKKPLKFGDGAMIERFGHFDTGSSKEQIAAFFEATY